mmetsp:Transcript_79520/g.199982  ORF Transcript_79520/g.199982 Transcript_79520/m.199982 type:complete len:546 (+) Transcript_79520:84-1721(+)
MARFLFALVALTGLAGGLVAGLGSSCWSGGPDAACLPESEGSDDSSLLARERIEHLGVDRENGRVKAAKEGRADGFKLAPGEHWVQSLPGLSFWGRVLYPGWRMATGYITVSKPSEKTTRKLFYWFVESRGNPSQDPLMLWTSGGPGCSGLSALMTEMGPFRPTSTGQLALNPHAWTDFVNMVFIEQPAGVGFSTIEHGFLYKYTDENTAEDMWTFMKTFVGLHPEFKVRPFYMASSSYGGHYMPVTAQTIIKSNKGEINFAGFTVGNPWTWAPDNNFGVYEKWYGYGLLPKPEYDEFMSKECWKIESSLEDELPEKTIDYCYKQSDAWWELLFPGGEEGVPNSTAPGYDEMGLSFPVCTSEVQRRSALRWLPIGRKFVSRILARSTYQPCLGNPMNNNYAVTYLNRPDVQRAIHVEGRVKWEDCSDPVTDRYSEESNNANMVPVYRELVSHGGVRVMIFSGTADSNCPLQGLQRWIWDQNYTVTENWVPYAVDGQSGGFTTKFEAPNGGGYRVTTVNGAGHMVSMTKPAEAKYIMRKWLSGEWS